MKTVNPFTPAERAALLEHWCSELIAEFHHERRVEMPRLERYALEAVQRQTERFEDEKLTARRFLDLNLPYLEQRIDIALLVLQFADFKKRALFILGNWDRRDSMIAEVLRAGGLTSDTEKWIAL